MTDSAQSLSRGRRIAARTLTVVGCVLAALALLAAFVAREALDEDRFRGTASELIANEEIRAQVAAVMVDRLYANVDVAGELSAKLPENLQGLAGPIAGLSREAADRAAVELLERPRVQALFVAAATVAQEQAIAVLEDDSDVVSTTGGRVVLDLRPLVLALGERFDIVPDLSSRIPEAAARITILESDELETAQTATQLLKSVALWLPLLALAAWAAALWLAGGARRRELRAIGVGLIGVGAAVLVIRAVAGTYLLDELVVAESVRPAGNEIYRIITDGLAASGWVMLAFGVIATAAAWLAGESNGAVSARTWLAPFLRRAAVAYAAWALLLVIAFWLLPFQQLWGRAILVVSSLIGLEALRRLTAREHPDAEPVDLGARLRGGLSSARPTRSGASGSPAAGTTGELEALARLHAAGDLSDDEYAAAKARVLGA